MSLEEEVDGTLSSDQLDSNEQGEDVNEDEAEECDGVEDREEESGDDFADNATRLYNADVVNDA
eukprot:CAMPEP_0170311260 /NCGR_PEP_ID=MMETSP0116_2-20130129/56133_1 /TAXON_ID=400756 /ORGANISM="Durinskia baltica, Strain CSIRO CS-38" /LENGTH=63 /DNA_ID=CAMNT_0010563569 /DNA_START=35 /DNA_END=223 /DNA_ORIENTATION=-